MELPVPRGVQPEEVVTCSQVGEPSARSKGRHMSLKEICIKVMAWLNFALALAGLAKFFPIGYLMALSYWEPIDQDDYEWSLDLISDTHLIFLVWFVGLMFIKALSGQIIVRPWRHFLT